VNSLARPSAVASAGGSQPPPRESGLKFGGYSSKIFPEQSRQNWHGQIGTQASAGGGSEISGLSAKNILSQVASASPSERAELGSLLHSTKKAPKKVVASDLYFNPAMDCFVDTEGNCFYSNLNETTLDPIPNMDRKIGTLRPGVDRESAQQSNFVEAKERSRKRKNRRNRTRKN
jgi:hypothetical protein